MHVPPSQPGPTQVAAPFSILQSNPIATIAIAQLFGTSLWFSANSAAPDLMRAWGIDISGIGLLTNAVQTGFILGTMAVALSGLADHFPASRIFVVSAFCGAAFNACFAWLAHGVWLGSAFRFLVGLSLAGIYPIGMKLVVSWAPNGRGAALAYLVGMLTLGSALPQGVRFLGARWNWQTVILTSSGLAVVGALLLLALGDGPHLALSHRAPCNRMGAVLGAFRAKQLRAAALGYFGHMWELYTFWTLVPMLVGKALTAKVQGPSIPGFAFLIIASGTAGCMIGGLVSRKTGSAPVAAFALATSGLCCFVVGFAGIRLPALVLLAILLVWGAAVVADSPQFSAVSAEAAPPNMIGAILAIQNSVGFAITIASITVATSAFNRFGLAVAWLLLPGPLLGLVGFYPAWGSARKEPRDINSNAQVSAQRRVG